MVQIKRKYEAIPAFAAPVCPEVYATPAVLLWIILGSIATFAWRRCSVTRLAAQITVSCVLVMSRLWNPAGVGVPGAGMYHEALWPVVCFGAFFVTPLLLYRFSRIGDSVLVFADSAVVALFAYLFAVQPYVPKMQCLCRTGRRAGSTTSTLAEALNHDVAPPRPFMINSI